MPQGKVIPPISSIKINSEEESSEDLQATRANASNLSQAEVAPPSAQDLPSNSISASESGDSSN